MSSDESSRDITSTNLLRGILQWAGALVVGTKVFKLINFAIKNIYFRTLKICGFNVWKNLGKWAVVTGGTDGIGRSYADKLAEKGFNICLISRNIDKLNSVASAIEKEFGVSTKTINADFTGGREIYENIENQLKELKGIGVLVNNVGMSYKYAEYFHAVPDGSKVMWDLINSNVTSCTMMMRIIMGMMDKGIVINVSSLMAVYPMPLLTTYAACKAYVGHLSKAIQYEYKDKGITIQCVLPAYVATKMSNIKRTSLNIPSANTYVESAIETVGVEDYTFGYFPHKIRGCIHQWLKNNMPARFNLALSMYFMQQIREGYFRKLERKKLEKALKQD
ncbi:hypothetical protein JTE90_029627 [Oedothorax gibbosus]|uniref:Uncharacterized protein n=1 Tax=Oedothorax gibbosus TaxID=931172 RepID=A0AAV6VGE1_9ARAC|nr:hypothetical protein JTE90_029627 [Oedothorax gibbosus]